MPSAALEGREQFRQIADNLPVVLALSNADLSKFLFVNRAYERIWGRTVESLYADSLSFLDGIHPCDLPRFKDAVAGLVRGTPIQGIECRIIRPDGSTCWVLCRGFPVRDSEGQVIRLVGSAEDITQQKAAEEKLQLAYSKAQEMLQAIRESEDRYRDLVEHSSDLLCTHDTQGILLSVNEPPLHILGYSREEMIGRPLREFVSPEARASCDAYLAQIQRDGFSKGILPVVTRSGEIRLWEYKNSLRSDGVSSPVVRGLAHDVTEQKRAESALRRSEEKFAKAFRSSPMEMVITTLAEGRFLEVNEAFERNTGYSRAEVLGRTAIELGMWLDPGSRSNVVADVAKHGRILNREIQIRAKSGAVGTKLYSAELIQIGKDRCLLAVSEDTTKRKRIEENLLRSEAFLAQGQRLTQTGSWTWNPSTGQVHWSRETYRIFDIDPNVERPSLDTVRRRLHQDDRLLFEQTLEHLQQEQQDGQGDFRLVVSSGATKHVHWVARPVFDAGGNLIEFVGTVMDVTERKNTEDELQRLSGQLLRLHDDERRGISRDLHDVTGQGLVALEATLGQLHEHVPKSRRAARKLLSDAMCLAKDCLLQIRTLSYVLYPPMLEQSGLEDAIRHFRDGFVQRTGIRVSFDISAGFERLARDTELAIFRVIQESLANIHRHSGSPHAEILLHRQSGIAVLEVRDHGSGIRNEKRDNKTTSPFPMGVGIASMHQRVNQVGGRLEIRSSRSGTVVWAAVPANA